MEEGARHPCLAEVEAAVGPCREHQGKAEVAAAEEVVRQTLRVVAAAAAEVPCLAGEGVEEGHPTPQVVAVEAEEEAGEAQSTGEEEEVQEEAGQQPVASGRRRPRRRCRTSPQPGRSARPCPPSAAGSPPRGDRRSLW